MQSFYLEAFQARLRYMDLPGSDTPVVFIHGLGCAASHDYVEVARHEALSKHRCILVDLLGFGYSDRPAHFLYTVTEHAKAVQALLMHLQLDETILLAHSMGGAIAIELCHLLGNRVKHLIITEGNLDAGGGPGSRSIAHQQEAHYLQQGHANLIEECRQQGNHHWMATAQISEPRAVYLSAKSLVEGTAHHWRALLYGFPMPCTYVIGTHSLPDPETERLPPHGIQVALLQGVGHNMANEDPAGLADCIGKIIHA